MYFWNLTNYYKSSVSSRYFLARSPVMSTTLPAKESPSSRTTARTALVSRLLLTEQITIGIFNSTNRTLQDGNCSLSCVQNKTYNVQWTHVGGSDIGYLRQLQQKYASWEVQVGMKTGDYRSIGPSNYTVTALMLTLAINHSLGSYTLDYNYMIPPNVLLKSMPRLIKQYDEE